MACSPYKLSGIIRKLLEILIKYYMTCPPLRFNTSILFCLLGYLVLFGYVVPVEAQTEDSEIPTSVGTVDTEESDVVVVPADEDAADSSTNVADTQTSNIPFDNYSREQLPTGAVFDDFVVGPGRFEVELAPGESRTVELVVSNRLGVDRVFSFNVEDMEAADDNDGSVLFLGERVGPYTLKDFISVPYDRFFLEHGTRARIPVTISLPPDAEPGGRYGSLLTSVVSEQSDQAGPGTQAGTAIISRIGTLFFVTTPGEIERDSALTDFSTLNQQKFFGSGPISFLIESENYGSVHTTPSGVLSITNMAGEEVGNVELPAWFVLPNAVRTRQVDWNRELLVGRYIATVQVNRGYGDIIDELSFSFWVIPWKIILMVFAVLFAFFLILRAFFSRFEFKRK